MSAGRRAAAPVAATACGFFVAAFAYQLAYPPTLNPGDESYLLYAAKRVFEGDALYRDVFDFQTPGSFYYYALAYALGGVSITSARVATALLNATSCALTFVLARYLASTAEALLAAIAFSVLCVPVFNVASHHWMATTLALATAAVLLAPPWRDSTRARPAAAGALAALAVCSQQGRGLWLVAWLAIALPALVWAAPPGSRVRRLLRELASASTGGAVVCVALLGHAAWRASIDELAYATYTWVVTRYAAFNVGLSRWAGFMFWTRGNVPDTALWLLEHIPHILGAEAARLAWSAWRRGARAQIESFCLFLLALATAGSIFYFPDYIHVSFIAPFTFVVLAGMVYGLRRFLIGDRRRVAAVALRAAWAIVLVLLLVKGGRNLQRAWGHNPLVYQTAFGRIAGTPQQAHEVADVRRMLDEHATSLMLSYPSDAAFYLLVPARNPTPYALLRQGLHTPEQFARAMEMLQRDPHTLVLVNGYFLQPDDPLYAFLKTRFRLLGHSRPFENGLSIYELWGNDAT